MAKPRQKLGVETVTGQEVEMWPIDDLKPNRSNARAHSPDQIGALRASLREYGWTMPCLIDEDGDLIAGEGRWRAAKEEGWKEAKVIVARGWSEERKRAYRILDNRIAEKSTWDKELLALELADLEKGGAKIEDLGFSAKELHEFLKDAPGRGGFLGDLTGSETSRTRAANRSGTTIGLTFQLSASERDSVVAFLSRRRDEWKVRNTAEALVRLAKEDAER